MEKGAHVPFHPTLADVSDQTKRAFSAVAAERVAAKLEAKAKPMEFQAKLEAAAQFALDAEAHEARRKLAKKKRHRDKGKKKKKRRRDSSSSDSDASSSASESDDDSLSPADLAAINAFVGDAEWSDAGSACSDDSGALAREVARFERAHAFGAGADADDAAAPPPPTKQEPADKQAKCKARRQRQRERAKAKKKELQKGSGGPPTLFVRAFNGDLDRRELTKLAEATLGALCDACGAADADEISAPFEELCRVPNLTFKRASVESIDFDAKAATLDDGTRIGGETLVVALGREAWTS